MGAQKPGRPRTRIRLASADAVMAAKQALHDAELALIETGLTRRELAEQHLLISPRTWRDYLDPDDPAGPTEEAVFRMETIARERLAGWRFGSLVEAWEMDPTSLELPGTEPTSNRRLYLTLGATLAVGVIVAGVAWALQVARTPGPEGVMIEVYNKVVLDESTMREDDFELYLTSSPDCASLSQCGVPGPTYRSGAQLRAICRTTGMMTTNRLGDTPNPENWDSEIWYGIEDGDRFGYVSEVWIHTKDRGGRNLRTCEPRG